MDPLWLSIAFVFGFAVRSIGLPPLVGYLVAGFVLNGMGASSGEFVEVTSELGVTLLLFTIGLKLKVKNILKPEIWGGATSHMFLITILYGIIIWALGFTGLSLFARFDWKIALLIAFAFSFSSTVFAVKVLEEKSEVNSIYGNISIGVLIIQDLVAVIFIALAAGKAPNWYALGIPFVLLALRPILFKLFDKIGHGELLILFGFFVALILGAEMFKFAGLKADLGALIVGVLLAGHSKSKELAESLLNFKDLFLIGFFLSIGMAGIPNFQVILIALFLALLINVKTFLYFWVFTRFQLRARTSAHASLALANYSKFGLIVAAVAVQNLWLPGEWLVTIAVALAISFVVSSPLNIHSHKILYFLKDYLVKYESDNQLIYDRTIDIRDAEILIFGMGNLGSATYDQLKKRYGQKVLALDYNEEIVRKHREYGRNVVRDDATDVEFWDYVKAKPIQQLKLVMLCMENHQSNLFAAERLKAIDYKGMLAATAMFEDEVKQLEDLGVHSAYNLYHEAGIGFADDICE
ncbi:cation:proton antiporter family protein, partial [Candidatus Venteria ishoeyi]